MDQERAEAYAAEVEDLDRFRSSASARTVKDFLYLQLHHMLYRWKPRRMPIAVHDPGLFVRQSWAIFDLLKKFFLGVCYTLFITECPGPGLLPYIVEELDQGYPNSLALSAYNALVLFFQQAAAILQNSEGLDETTLLALLIEGVLGLREKLN